MLLRRPAKLLLLKNASDNRPSLKKKLASKLLKKRELEELQKSRSVRDRRPLPRKKHVNKLLLSRKPDTLP